jgi:hypothetical protein
MVVPTIRSGNSAERPVTKSLLDWLPLLIQELNAGAGIDVVWNGTNWLNPSSGETV